MAMSSSLNAIRFGIKPLDLSLKGNVTTYTGLPNYIEDGTRENCNLESISNLVSFPTNYTTILRPYVLTDSENNIYIFYNDHIKRVSYSKNEVKTIAGKRGYTDSFNDYTIGPALNSYLSFQGIPAIDLNKNIYMIASSTNPYKTIIKLTYDSISDTYSISEYAGRKLDGSYITGTSFLSSGFIQGLASDKTNADVLYVFQYPGASFGNTLTSDVYKLTYSGSLVSQKIISSISTSPYTSRLIDIAITATNIYYIYYVVYNTTRTYRIFVISNLSGTPSVGSRYLMELGSRIVRNFTADNSGNLIINSQSSGLISKMSLSTYVVTDICNSNNIYGTVAGIVSISSDLYVCTDSVGVTTGSIYKINTNGIYNGWYCGSNNNYNSPTLSANRFEKIRHITYNTQFNNLIISDAGYRFIDANSDASGVYYNPIPNGGNFVFPPRNWTGGSYFGGSYFSVCVDENNNLYGADILGVKKYDRINNSTSTISNIQGLNNSLDSNGVPVSMTVYYNNYVYATTDGTVNYSYNTSGNRIVRISTINGTSNTVYTDTSICIVGIKGNVIYYTDLSRTTLYKTTIGFWTKTTVKTGFTKIVSIAADDFGNIYIADCTSTAPQTSIIKKLDSGNNLTNLVGGLTGYVDGDKTIAKFATITSMAYNSSNYKLYVSEYGNLSTSNVPITASDIYKNQNYYTVIREIS